MENSLKNINKEINNLKENEKNYYSLKSEYDSLLKNYNDLKNNEITNNTGINDEKVKENKMD